jgi:hypothetical protein
MLNAMTGDAHAKNRNILIGPSIATGDWTPEVIWNTGFVDTFAQNLITLTVEQCAFLFTVASIIPYSAILHAVTPLTIVSLNSVSVQIEVHKTCFLHSSTIPRGYRSWRLT